jgi:transcriptional regulator with XRE-family HTH domain
VARGTVWFDGSALRRARRVAGDAGGVLSLDELALRLRAHGWSGASRQTLIGYEAGRSVPEPARLALLARVLGVSARTLAAVPDDRVGLTELRHWAGLTAAEAAVLLEVSTWSLLRLERTGLLPADHPDAQGAQRIIAAAAHAYAVSPDLVRQAWRRVQARSGRY